MPNSNSTFDYEVGTMKGNTLTLNKLVDDITVDASCSQFTLYKGGFAKIVEHGMTYTVELSHGGETVTVTGIDNSVEDIEFRGVFVDGKLMIQARPKLLGATASFPGAFGGLQFGGVMFIM